MKTRVFAVCAVVFLFCGIVHAGLNDGLVAYYPFNGNANDESGNGHNGTVNGAILTSDRHGHSNSAYWFDGINNNIVHNAKIYNDFTLCAWIKPEEKINPTDPNRTFLGDANGSTAQGYIFFISPSNTIQFSFGDGTHWAYDLISPTKNNNNEWLFVAIDRQGPLLTLYINGALDTSVDIKTNNAVYNMPYTTIGGAAKSWFFHGSIDDVRYYNRSLSASEIQQLYRGGTCSSEVVKFTAGTPAKAADVNANFDALNCQIQAMKAIICQDHPTASICQ